MNRIFYKISAIIILILFASAFPAETLQLQDCIDLALRNNPDLLQSQISVRQTDISKQQAWSQLLPSVSTGASASTSGPLVSPYESSWSWSANASLDQTFYRPGLYSRIRLAGVQQEISATSYEDLKNQIQASVERVYYQILTSDTLIGVYEANIKLADEQIVKMQRMVDLGLKRQTDLLKTEVQRGTFESQLVQEERNLLTLKRNLNVLMGRQPDTEFDIADISTENVDVPEFLESLDLMYAKNPALAIAAKRIAAQNLSVKIAREAYLPSVSGSYSLSRHDQPQTSPIDQDGVSVRLSLNIFDGFQKNQNLQLEKLDLNANEITLESTVREFTESLANQYNSLETQKELLEIQRLNLESASKDLELVTEQYAAGFSSILDLLTAQVSHLQAQASLVRTVYARKIIVSEIMRLIAAY